MTGAVAYPAYTLLDSSLPELLVTGIVFFQIVNNLTKLQKQIAGRGRHRRFLCAHDGTYQAGRSAKRNPYRHRIAPDLGAGCRFEGVTFAHGKAPVVSNATFDIPANKITVLQGPSGSGKTTLIDLLIGLNTAQKGKILIGGSPLKPSISRPGAKALAMCPRNSCCSMIPSMRTSAFQTPMFPPKHHGSA